MFSIKKGLPCGVVDKCRFGEKLLLKTQYSCGFEIAISSEKVLCQHSHVCVLFFVLYLFLF